MGVSLKKYYFGKSKMTGINTFIGGIGATMNTPSLLAAALGITADRISMFSVVNNNIECAIKGSYSTQNTLNTDYTKFRGSSTLTYFYDMQGLCVDLGYASFANITSSKLHLYFPGIIVQVSNTVFANTFIPVLIELPNCTTLPIFFTGAMTRSYPGTIVIPKCTNIGTTKGFDNVFNLTGKSGLTIYAPISEQTSNAGGVEGDLADIITAGGTVIFVPNYTAPNQITNLTAVIQSSTTVKLNFTPPTSTNAIVAYEVYVNGIYKTTVAASGQDVAAVSADKIKIRARDIYYNKSVLSNEAIPTASGGYHPLFQSNVIDEAIIRGFAMPTTTKLGELNQLMIEAIANGMFAKQDFFFVFPTGNAALADFTRICWKRKGVLGTAHDMTYNGEFWRPNGTSGYFDPEYNPATQGINYTLNNAGVGALITQDVGTTDNAFVFGQTVFNSDQTEFYRNKIGSNSGLNINGSSRITPIDAREDGYMTFNRLDAANQLSNVKNLASQAQSHSSIAIRSGKLVLFRRNMTYASSVYRAHIFHAGGGMTKTEHDNFRTSLNNFLTNMGQTPVA